MREIMGKLRPPDLTPFGLKVGIVEMARGVN